MKSKCDRVRTQATNKQNQQPTGHCESTHEQSDVPSPDHDTLAPLPALADPGALVLPRGPDPHEQDQDVEDHDGHETLGVDGHRPSVRFPPRRDQVLLRAEDWDVMERALEEISEERYFHGFL